MRRTIVVADRDEKLQQGFMTVFSKEQYEILYAPNGKEVEKIAARLSPDIYLVNVNLPKMNGIEVHKKLQKQGYLDKASFFFLKDEADTTELLGYQADGVIEKPINFFRVYETITSEEDVIELTDLVEEEEMSPAAGQRTADRSPGTGPRTAAASGRSSGSTRTAVEETKGPVSEEVELQTMIGRRLRQAMDDTVRDSAACFPEMKGPVEAGTPQSELEQQFKAVLNQAMEEAAEKLSSRFAPILTRYVEDYVKQMLLEITEKVIREEIDKLLKESVA